MAGLKFALRRTPTALGLTIRRPYLGSTAVSEVQRPFARPDCRENKPTHRPGRQREPTQRLPNNCHNAIDRAPVLEHRPQIIVSPKNCEANSPVGFQRKCCIRLSHDADTTAEMNPAARQGRCFGGSDFSLRGLILASDAGMERQKKNFET